MAKFLQRLQRLICEYNTKHLNKHEKIQYIASSATINNPYDFGNNFFNEDVTLVKTTDEDVDFKKGPYNKITIFCSPKAYRMIDTTGYSILRSMEFEGLKILAFVNSRTIISQILYNAKTRFSAEPRYKPLIKQFDGHSANFTRQERAEREEKFNRGELKALVATSTLEVGVDFKGINFLILYGAPYSFNNYLQRIGRAGRKNDSIIINMLSPANPIDIYYYRNAIDMITSPSRYIEYPSFPKNNDKIENKHIVSSIFDACNFYLIDAEEAIKWLFKNDAQFNAIKKWLVDSYSQKKVDGVLNYLVNNFSRYATEKDKIDAIKRDFKLTNLRKIEDNVQVEFLIESNYAKTRGIRNKYLKPWERSLKSELDWYKKRK